jgi:hypothetical protein
VKLGVTTSTELETCFRTAYGGVLLIGLCGSLKLKQCWEHHVLDFQASGQENIVGMYIDRVEGNIYWELKGHLSPAVFEAPEFRDLDTPLWVVAAIFTVDSPSVTINNYIPWREKHHFCIS